MEFITVEQFQEQPKEIQQVFLDWWQPNKGDIYCNLYNNQQDNVLVINNCQLEVFKTFKDDIKLYGIPLLTEGQLRKFIEDKTKTKIETSLTVYNQYALWLVKVKGQDYETFDTREEDLLQAYWKVACEVATDICKL
jgi:hypothetical protein|uniref:Uncharacterized protein n=1 Tax=Siphoviridae sp. cteLh2 TaxID=2825590 RepID=A0A8S5U5U4_9CAUD|nr:hypothetical protein [uncultured Lachnoclostridium sp.]DAF89849.1 MAG TPA: hypothetical protein [Siphoviridae sp. cteLh2]